MLHRIKRIYRNIFRLFVSEISTPAADLICKQRQLLTLCIVSALGGAEGQVKAHVQGNLNVGNAKEQLIDAITHCLPYMGFPRTLNTLACINEISPEN